MNIDQVKKAAWSGAVSSYSRIVVRIGLGFITFRMLFQGLDADEFGFWSLMWSVFGYGILLDFGFGYAAQRRVAQCLAKGDWEALSHALSTIFFFYFAVAGFIGVVGWAMADSMMHWFNVPAAKQAEFKPATVVFFSGMALGFPLGVFPEVLRGLQKTDTANRIGMIGTIANAALVALALYFNWGLTSVFVIALLCVLGPDLMAGYAAMKAMPEVRLRLSLFRRSDLLSTGKFSLIAWLNMISNLLRNKMDQVVVGGALGLPAVTLYQAGAKAGELFGVVTRPIADSLGPAAAFLYADSRKDSLREMLVNGLRMTMLVAAPLYFGGAIFMDFLVRVLTGLKVPNADVLLVAQVLLFWYFHVSYTHMVFKTMYMMCGQEKRMMWHSIAEALMNVVLSISLTLWLKSIVGVALGSVLPTLLFGWLVLWPWTAKEAGCGKWELLMKTGVRPLLGCVPMIVTGVLCRWLLGGGYGRPEWLPCLAGMAITGVAGLAGIWTISLTPADKAAVLKRLPARFRTAPAG
ncbi:MAG: hypothetical protein JWM59_3009 [Verrucomicrobiales bacterium]|nr:hypothetical protein [Verrucomicrobiales bacterium]